MAGEGKHGPLIPQDEVRAWRAVCAAKGDLDLQAGLVRMVSGGKVNGLSHH